MDENYTIELQRHEVETSSRLISIFRDWPIILILSKKSFDFVCKVSLFAFFCRGSWPCASRAFFLVFYPNLTRAYGPPQQQP